MKNERTYYQHVYAYQDVLFFAESHIWKTPHFCLHINLREINSHSAKSITGSKESLMTTKLIKITYVKLCTGILPPSYTFNLDGLIRWLNDTKRRSVAATRLPASLDNLLMRLAQDRTHIYFAMDWHIRAKYINM